MILGGVYVEFEIRFNHVADIIESDLTAYYLWPAS
jgi:hypothetical protein